MGAFGQVDKGEHSVDLSARPRAQILVVRNGILTRSFFSIVISLLTGSSFLSQIGRARGENASLLRPSKTHVTRTD